MFRQVIFIFRGLFLFVVIILAKVIKESRMMSRTQKAISISIKNQILTKLRQNQPTINPICPLNKTYRKKQNKYSKKPIISIQEEIQQIKLKSSHKIKGYKTQKTIKLIQPPSQTDYELTSILKTPQYKKLQVKLLQMNNCYSVKKTRLNKQIKQIEKQIQKQNKQTQNLYKKMSQIDRDVEQNKQKYYEMKRMNYELRCELDEQVNGPYLRMMDRRNNNRLVHNYQGFQNGINLDQMSYQEILELEERLGKENVGLNTQTINKLKPTKYLKIMSKEQKQQLTCCICCQSIQKDNQVIKFKKCQHIHHNECIKKWLKIKRHCPLCKQEVQL